MYRKMLLAYDGSRDGRTALIEGAELAQLCRAEVILLAVVEDAADVALAQGYATGSLAGEQLQQVRDILDEGLGRLRGRGLAASTSLAFGSPGERIAAAALEVGADLVVIGHRPHGLWARWLSEPVGEYLLAKLPCSVLIVAPKPPDRPS